MCLGSITRYCEDSDEVRIGYKFVMKYQGKMFTAMMNTPLFTDKANVDCGTQHLATNDMLSVYPSGFHCFVNYQDAVKCVEKASKKPLPPDYEIEIVAVAARHVVVEGIQPWYTSPFNNTLIGEFPAFVAKEIEILPQLPAETESAQCATQESTNG